ncbi:copper-binding protein [Sorangium sp. So ce296]|uniref:copper-binding protein n=1 Tax=Sorangium sp. So ce296 TaxID=3133296 RepID=UPI003F5D83CB
MTPPRCALAMLVLAPLMAVLACRGEGGDGTRYHSRGVLRNIAHPNGQRVLLIHHEPIPDFVSRDGRKKGMASMAMPFGVAPEVSLDGLEIDDKIEFTFAVDWERYPTSFVTDVKELPPDTPLQAWPP